MNNLTWPTPDAVHYFSWPTLFNVSKNSDPPQFFIAHPYVYFMTGPLLNNILWMAPDHQAVYLKVTITHYHVPYWIHVQCKNHHTYISHLRRRINIFIYYSTIMSFHHIRSRECAKYEAVSIIILFNNVSVWFLVTRFSPGTGHSPAPGQSSVQNGRGLAVFVSLAG